MEDNDNSDGNINGEKEREKEKTLEEKWHDAQKVLGMET